MDNNSALEDFGFANGWELHGGTPQKIKDCKHKLIEKKEGNNFYSYSCEVCGYIYSVDSSD